MNQKNIRENKQTAKYSRVLNSPKVLALGASVSVGVGVYGILGILMQHFSMSALIKPYLTLIVFATPLILTYVEKAVNSRGQNGIYAFLKQSEELWVNFFGGWFMILGYAALIGLVSSLMGTYIQAFVSYFFAYDIDARYFAVGILLLQVMSIFIRKGIKRSIRTSFILIALVLLSVFTFQGFFTETPINLNNNVFDGNLISFNIVSLLVASFWGLFFIFRERKAIIKPRKTILPISFAVIGLTSILGFSSLFVLKNSSSYYSTIIPLAELGSRFHFASNDVMSAVYTFFIFGCFGYILRKSFYDGVNFVNLMINDGFLINRKMDSEKEYYWLWPAVAFTIIAILFIFGFSTIFILGLVSMTFLMVTILVHLPNIFHAKPKYSKSYYLKLPFYPLFPGLSIAISFLLFISLPAYIIVFSILFLLLGAGYYFLFSRKTAVQLRRDQIVIINGINDGEEIQENYRVMVGVANPVTAKNLIEAAIEIAQARDGEVLALRTISYSGQMSEVSRRRKAEREYQALVELIEPIDSQDMQIIPLIRLSVQPAEGILDTIIEEKIDLLLLGWEDKSYSKKSFMNTFMNEILHNASCEVAILKGKFPKRLRQISVPTSGGPYASMGLSLACDLAENNNAKVSLVNVVLGRLSPEKKDNANQSLEEMRSVLEAQSDARVEAKILQADNVVQRLTREANRTDLLMMGASKEGILERPYFGGMPVEIASNTKTPILITRGIETSKRVFLQRAWGFFFDSLPTLNVTRRIEVMRDMRDASKPSADFFILITLASMIASLGLLQNSAAVIIGAMLVAPLMSPILAMGMSLVTGNLRQFWVATETAVKGIAVSILVGALVSIFSPINAATNEILARIAPNLLDLMVAIASGAAAGYALSRKEVSTAMPGVAISAALVPPLCVIGYGVGTAQFTVASGALLLFVTNLIAILLSASVVFLALGFYPQRTNRSELLRTLNVTIVSLVAVFAILAISTVATVSTANREQRVNAIFSEYVKEYDIEIVDFEIQHVRNEYMISTQVIEKGNAHLSSEALSALQVELEEAVDGNVSIEFTVLSASIVDTSVFTDDFSLYYSEISKFFEENQIQFSNLNIMEEKGTIVIKVNIITTAENDRIKTYLQDMREQLQKNMQKPIRFEINLIVGEQFIFE